MEITEYYDNTMLSTYKDCPRKFFLRHVLGWRSQGTALPLVFGLSWHAGMDAVWTFGNKGADPDEIRRLAMTAFLEVWEEEGLPVDMDLQQIEVMSPRTPMIAQDMYVHYIQERWTVLRKAELLAVEQPFAVPLPGLDNIWYIGRLDKVISLNGEVNALEHKTTTAYSVSSGFQSSYVESWYSDSQVKGYQFGGGLYFPKLSQVWVDAALVHKKVHDKFRFIPVAHQQPLLEEWLDDTKQWISRLKQDRMEWTAKGGLAPGVFPKNEGQCFGKFGGCAFLNICRTTSMPDRLKEPPPGYMVEFWKPFELLGIDKLVNKDNHEQSM